MTFDPHKVRLLCFDIDGTLADTDDVMVEWLYRLTKPLNHILPELDTLRLARKIVLALETPANAFLTILDTLGIDQFYYRARKWFLKLSSRPIKSLRLIPGAASAVRCLADSYSVAIISVRDEHFTQAFIQHSELQDCVSLYASAESCLHTKPYPDPILWVAGKANIPPENCLMIGDTTVDIRAGKHAGAQTVGVLSGFGVEAELMQAGADLILPDVSYLLEILPPKET